MKKWKAEITIRVDDDFEIKPYGQFHLYNGFNTYFGWLWFRFNIMVYRRII